MANRIYNAAASGLGGGSYDWSTGTWKVSLLTSAYTFDSAHDFHNDLSGIVATATITGRGISIVGTNAVWDASDVSFTGVAGGSAVVAFVIWRDSGVSSTSPLLMFRDTANGIPFTTTGADFILAWDDGPTKILSIPTVI